MEMATCQWCGAGDDDNTATLQNYCCDGLTSQEQEELNYDLNYCNECVDAYHRARTKVSPALHKQLWNLEIARLLVVFQEMSSVEMEDDDLYFVENGQEQPIPKYSPEEFHTRVRFPLMEVLKYPYLLCHKELCEMVVNVLCKMDEMKNPVEVFDKCQGVYLLMVHPNEMVRRWAIATAKSLGKVDRDRYYDLQEVFSCMFLVLELGISDFPDRDCTYYSGMLEWIPSHLYDSGNKKNYWLGICMLLMQLDSQAMDSLFMGLIKKTNIPQCIINVMTDSRIEGSMDSDPFWPALHCLMVILDRLGSKIWCEMEPVDAFTAVTEAASYKAEIENIRQKSKSMKVDPENEDMLSCSQIVYDCYPTERSDRSSDWSHNSRENNINEIFEELGSLVNVLQSEMGQGMRVYSSTFLWFIPFVRAVVEVGDQGELSELVITYIDQVLRYLFDEVDKDVLYGRTQTCDKVTEFFIIILVDIVELLLNKGCYKTLRYCAPIWVEVVVLCSTLGEICSESYKAPLVVSRFGRGRSSRSCKKLIFSLLKRGKQIRVVFDDFDFLNRQMRKHPYKALDLAPPKSQALQTYLKDLIKVLMDSRQDGPTSSAGPSENENSTLTDLLQQAQYKNAAAGPNVAKDAVCFPKEEPLQDYEEYEDYNHLDTKVKNEPHSLGLNLDFNHMKPDLGKMQEISTKLNDDHNISKMQAIVKKSLADPEQKQKEYSSLTESHLMTAPPTFSDSAKLIKSSEKIDDDDDDDEPLNVRRNRLKKLEKLPFCDSEAHARQTSLEFSSSARREDAANIIIISDDDDVPKTDVTFIIDSSSDCEVNGATWGSSSDPDLNECPGRDYDGNLSESQVFEFETQENVASAWADSHFDCPVVTKKPMCKPPSKDRARLTNINKEPMLDLVNETQPVTEEDIKKACQQAEKHIRKEQQLQAQSPPSISASLKPRNSNEKWDDSIKPNLEQIQTQPITDGVQKKCQIDEQTSEQQQQLLLDQPTSSLYVQPKPSSSSENRDHFIQPKSTSSTTKILGPTNKGKQFQKRSLLIEPLEKKIKKPRKSLNATTTYTSVAHPSSVPAIVPPKKVRKPVEPESVAERMGLKKKDRKAFDFSQRSLNTLGELRNHGQNVSVELPQKSKRVRRRRKTAQKFTGKDRKMLIASQEMQYFRQSRGMLQKSTATTASLPKPIRTPVPEFPPKAKNAVGKTVNLGEEEEEEEEDDYNGFLPCSQPDPAQKSDQNTKQAESPIEVNKTRALFDNKCKETTLHLGGKTDVETADSTAKCPETTKEGDYEDEEWWHLTQNEPTDMELCSQMDTYDDNFLNTQREPVDMDIDTEIQQDAERFAEGTYVQPKLLFASELQNEPHSVPTQSIPNEDELFLKPDVSLSEKKAKSSTMKVYATSNRSACLVEDMEKAAKPLPGAKVVKAKVARPMPVMPPLKASPQPEFRRPLPPRCTPHPPNQALESAFPNGRTPTSHPSSCKIYSRPEDPVLRSRTVDQAPMYDQSMLIQEILKWDYQIFTNYESDGVPKNLCPFPLKQVTTRFSCLKEYFDTLYPLLLINAFEEMAKKWQETDRIKLNLELQALEYCNRTAIAKFKASLNAQQEKMQLYPKEEDLILLWLPMNTGAYGNESPSQHGLHVHFGYVSRSNVISSGEGRLSTLHLNVQTRGNVSSVNTQLVPCAVIGSLISTQREFKALCSLPRTMKGHQHILLTPHVSFFTPVRESSPDLDMPEYNKEQAKAICCGVAMVKKQIQQRPTTKILLIHGPPGTGKSKTIVGLLQRLFSEQNERASVTRSKSHRMRVLLCAPSNAAIDSLMKKVILIFKEKCRNIHAPQGNCGDINLVRLGSEKTISKRLIPFSLDSQTAKKVQAHCDSDVQRQKEKLDQTIDCLSRQCTRTPKTSPEFKKLMEKKQACLDEREKLGRHLKEFHIKRQEVHAKILRDAHVICCTLSTSGGAVLESAFRLLGSEAFSCVIIDEASQAKETETLIPLLYQCPSLILVGDHEQLPPTVISQKAKDLGYDQSLMARLWKSLHHLNPSPVIFLSVQYRMHPDICEFPSKYIYNRNLKNDCETTQKRCSLSWSFVPYLVFDVTDGRESKEKGSFSNPKEVKLVMMLLKMIGEKQDVRVGIITPYNAQKRCILKALKRDADNKYPEVEVDTVDGFQGREMDCIIVSCVRANSEMGSIGFLRNRQRMNVTITRAKFSLFILGHLRTLQEDSSDWGALINDAVKRGRIIKTQERDFHKTATEVLKSNVPSRGSSRALPACRRIRRTSHPPPKRIPMEVNPAPDLHTHSHKEPNGGHSPSVSSSSSPLGQSDWPRDPRLSTRFHDPQSIRQNRQQRDRRNSFPDPRQHRSSQRDPPHGAQVQSDSTQSSGSPQRQNHRVHWSSSVRKYN